MEEQYTLIVLLVVLLFGLITPSLLKWIRIPFVSALMVAGAILGPHGFHIIGSDPIIEFFGFLGFTLLMLLAGLETNIKEVQKSAKSVAMLALLNGVIPFVGGIVMTLLFGYSLETALLIGVIFISTSVAIVIPTIAASQLKGQIRQLMTASVVMEDVVSLVALAMILQTVNPITSLPIPFYYVVLLVSIIALLYILPRLANKTIGRSRFLKNDDYEIQIRFAMVTLIGVLLYFSGLGVHPILAAFLTGMLLTQIIKSKQLYDRIHTIGHALFIPVFFFLVGMNMDFSVFEKVGAGSWLVAGLLLTLVSTKVISGLIGGKITGLSTKESLYFGMISTSQLTTTLAAAFTAFSIGLIDAKLYTAIATISIITTLSVPIASTLISFEKN